MVEPKVREILDRLDIQVINRTSKGWLVASCPFAEHGYHERGTDRSPSFNVHVDPKKISGFNCFTCHQTGSLVQLVRKLEALRTTNYGSLSINAVIWETPETFDAWDAPIETDPEPEPLNRAAYIGMYPLAWEHDAARAYLQARGITERAAAIMELQFDPGQQRIIVPVYDRQNRLFGFNGRTILPEEQWPKNQVPVYRKSWDYAGLEKNRNVLGIHNVKPGKPIFLVEGLFALLHLYSIGADQYVNIVASLGSNLSDFQRDMLIDAGEAVFVLYDNDAAGEIGIYGQWDGIRQKHLGGGALDKLKEHVPTFLPYYPEGITDPDFLTLDNILWMLQTSQFVA